MSKQLEFEETMSQMGHDKIISGAKDATKDFDSEYAKNIVKSMIIEFSPFLYVKIQEEIDKYKTGNKPIIIKLMNRDAIVNRNSKCTKIDCDQLSFICTKIIVSSLRNDIEKCKETLTVSKLGRAVNMNIVHEQRFSTEDEVKIGAYLIRYFAECFPEYIKLEKTYSDRKSKWEEKHIVATEEYINKISNNISVIAEMSTTIYPMIEQPLDWDINGHNGGYFSELFKTNLIKRKDVKENAGVNYNIVQSVNAIQKTPWTINTDIFHVLADLSSTKPETLKKVFPLTVEKSPERPYPKELKYADMNETEKQIHQQWSSQDRKLKKDKLAKASVDLSREAALQQANFFITDDKYYEGKIWFPHDLDYRDRVYNKSMTGLNTQGADYQKGLIKFANSRQVETERGIYWLKVNMANLMGFDKLKLDDRVAMCNSLEDEIRECVKDPIRYTKWHGWDKPVQGLAAAIEYVKWLDNDQAFIQTHVQLDGLCNGVQNLAALTRDQNVAPHVGLIWTPERGDVYTYVLDSVINRISNLDSPFTQEWINSELLIRGLTKTPVMTRSYGATLHGIKDGCKEFIEGEGKASMFKDYWKAGTWMGDQIWASMNEALEGPMKFMEWVQTCAGLLAKANLPFPWTNPAGGKCVQSPFEMKRKAIVAKFNGKLHKYWVLTHTNKIAKSQAMSGSSPNLIHSCDASHLIGTSVRCSKRGMTDFAFVHDSFGGHPDDAQMLLDQTKAAWVEQYSIDWISRWYEEWTQYGMQKGVSIPRPDEFFKMGNLDVNDVLKSDFFFA